MEHFTKVHPSTTPNPRNTYRSSHPKAHCVRSAYQIGDTTITEWLFDNAPAFDKRLVRAQYTTESLSSFCGIFLVVSGLLKAIFLKFISRSMVDSIQVSSIKTSILGLQSLRSHGESTGPHRYLIRVSQGT